MRKKTRTSNSLQRRNPHPIINNLLTHKTMNRSFRQSSFFDELDEPFIISKKTIKRTFTTKFGQQTLKTFLVI